MLSTSILLVIGIALQTTESAYTGKYRRITCYTTNFFGGKSYGCNWDQADDLCGDDGLAVLKTQTDFDAVAPLVRIDEATRSYEKGWVAFFSDYTTNDKFEIKLAGSGNTETCSDQVDQDCANLPLWADGYPEILDASCGVMRRDGDTVELQSAYCSSKIKYFAICNANDETSGSVEEQKADVHAMPMPQQPVQREPQPQRQPQPRPPAQYEPQYQPKPQYQPQYQPRYQPPVQYYQPPPVPQYYQQPQPVNGVFAPSQYSVGFQVFILSILAVSILLISCGIYKFSKTYEFGKSNQLYAAPKDDASFI